MSAKKMKKPQAIKEVLKVEDEKRLAIVDKYEAEMKVHIAARDEIMAECERLEEEVSLLKASKSNFYRSVCEALGFTKSARFIGEEVDVRPLTEIVEAIRDLTRFKSERSAVEGAVRAREDDTTRKLWHVVRAAVGDETLLPDVERNGFVPGFHQSRPPFDQGRF